MIAGRAATERKGRLLGTGNGEARSHGGKAPCLVVLHGFGGTTSEVEPVIDAAVNAGYAVEAPLMPGHGTRVEKLQNTTFEEMTAAMEAVVRAAVDEHGRVVICGFSLGSLVAMELAARSLPGVEGLVVMGNAIDLVAPLRMMFEVVEKRGWKLPDWYFVKFWSADVRDRAVQERIVTYDRNPLRASLEVHRGGAHVKTRLAAITVPTLILHGVKDRVCPVANVELVRSRISSNEIVVRTYANSAHLVACDHDREEVAKDLLDFLAKRE